MDTTDTQLTNLAARLENLERSNRRLKVAMLSVPVLLVGALLMGAAAGKRTVEGERFIFRDGAGKERLILDSAPGGPTCTLTDINGKPSFRVVINRDGFFQMVQQADPNAPSPVQKRPVK